MRIKKYVTATLAVAIVLVTAVCLAASDVGNSNSYKFHYSGCRYARKIKDYNKVYFDDREDAIDKGYSPCKVCRP